MDSHWNAEWKRSAQQWVVRLSVFAMAMLAPSQSDGGIFIRSMPEPGTWSLWRFETTVSKEPEDLWIRLTAGDRFDRAGRSWQALNVVGVWAQGEEPAPFSARFEVDLKKLANQEYGGEAVRFVEGEVSVKEEESKRVLPHDALAVFFRHLVVSLRQPVVERGTVRLRGDALRDHEFRMLRAKADTRHFGSGQAPESDFVAWVSDKFCFGVGKWETVTTMMLDHRRHIITITCTVEKTGTTAATSMPTELRKRDGASTTTTSRPEDRDGSSVQHDQRPSDTVRDRAESPTSITGRQPE